MVKLPRLRPIGALTTLIVLALGGCAGQMGASIDPMEAARDLAAACGRSPCRTEVRALKLSAENGRFELMTDLFPYADSGAVAIFPGEAFIVEFDDNRSVANPRFVRVVDSIDIAAMNSQSAGARPTMAFEFKQDPGKPNMTLEIKSTVDVHVKYDATMWVPTPNGMQMGHTSSCPVFANAGGIETWPHPIAMLVLTNFRVQSLEGTFACQ
jgi:hypothetical protein